MLRIHVLQNLSQKLLLELIVLQPVVGTSKPQVDHLDCASGTIRCKLVEQNMCVTDPSGTNMLQKPSGHALFLPHC